jgi:hypothetical protein
MCLCPVGLDKEVKEEEIISDKYLKTVLLQSQITLKADMTTLT